MQTAIQRLHFFMAYKYSYNEKTVDTASRPHTNQHHLSVQSVVAQQSVWCEHSDEHSSQSNTAITVGTQQKVTT